MKVPHAPFKTFLLFTLLSKQNNTFWPLTRQFQPHRASSKNFEKWPQKQKTLTTLA